MAYPYQIKTLEEYKKTYQKSIEAPEEFWAGIARNFLWRKEWDKVLEWNFKEPNVKWFINGKLNIVGSEMVPESGLLKGNSVSLLLCCSSAAEASEYFIKLSDDGRATEPLRSTFWGALFGGLVDKFGIHWLFSCEDLVTGNQ